MPFITVNGFTARIFDGTHTKTAVKRGGRRRSFRSQMRDARRGVRRRHEFTTCFMDFEEADTFINVINGLGQLIYYRDGLQATSGLMPFVSDLVQARFTFANTPFAGFENGSLFGDAGASACQLSYDAQLPEDWTLFWLEESNGAHRQTSRSDRAAWADGVRDDSAFGGSLEWRFKVLDGIVHMTTDGGDGGELHHLAMLPYKASASFIEAWHAMTQPWGPTPALRVTGDVLATDRELFFGEVTGVDIIQKPSEVPGFGWLNNAKVVSFALDEIAYGYIADAKVEQGTVPNTWIDPVDSFNEPFNIGWTGAGPQADPEFNDPVDFNEPFNVGWTGAGPQADPSFDDPVDFNEPFNVGWTGV